MPQPIYCQTTDPAYRLKQIEMILVPAMNPFPLPSTICQALCKITGMLLAVCFLLMASPPLPALAGDEITYEDIYLSKERVCRNCRWEWANRKQIRLTNRQGHTILVAPNEIIGIDNHPVMRKLLIKSLHGIGLPGPVIVPAAFEDANEFVCKYCDAVGR